MVVAGKFVRCARSSLLTVVAKSIIENRRSSNMEYRIDGISLIYNRSMNIGELAVKISYLTALLFVNGNHIGSIYPKDVPERILISVMDDYRKEYSLTISDEDISKIISWMKRQI